MLNDIIYAVESFRRIKGFAKLIANKVKNIKGRNKKHNSAVTYEQAIEVLNAVCGKLLNRNEFSIGSFVNEETEGFCVFVKHQSKDHEFGLAWDLDNDEDLDENILALEAHYFVAAVHRVRKHKK